MDTISAVTLRLTASTVEDYCRDLARRSATLEKRVSALDAISTFVSSQTGPGEQAKSEFSVIKQVLRDQFEEARSALLDERARRLRQDLESRRLTHLAVLYTSVSRDAFWTLLGRAEQMLDAPTLASLRIWASEWLIDVKERARQASPYPDVVDFAAANIDSEEYLCMIDIGRFLGTET